MKTKFHFLHVSLLFVSLLFIPGCFLMDWFKGKPCSECSTDNKNSAALITFDQQKVFTCEDFKEKLQLIYGSRPDIESMVKGMSEDQQKTILQQILDGLLAERLIFNYAKEEKLIDPVMLEQARKQLEIDLAVRAFQERLTIEIQQKMKEISDADAQAFYDANKEKLPVFQNSPFMVNGAQVKVAAEKKSDEKVLPKYADFTSVKDLVKQVMMQDQMPKIYSEKLEELKKKYNAVVYPDCLESFITKKETEVSPTEESKENSTTTEETAPVAEQVEGSETSKTL